MYIPKPWLLPGALSVLLLAALMAVAAHGITGPSPVTETLGLAAHTARPADAWPLQPGEECELPADELGVEEAARILRYLEGVEANRKAEEARLAAASVEVNDFATNSGVIRESQFNDGGFGDVGFQWRDVENNAPITNVHISGTGNSTTIITGDGNVITGDGTAPDPSGDGAPDDTASPVATPTDAPSVDAPADPPATTPPPTTPPPTTAPPTTDPVETPVTPTTPGPPPTEHAPLHQG